MKATDEQNVRWGEAFNRVRALAVETGVELVEYNSEDIQ